MSSIMKGDIMLVQETEYNTLKGFQRTMYKLLNERYIDICSDKEKCISKINAPRLANILYEDYYDYVAPNGYPKKHSEYKTKNIAAITKHIERDMLKENPWEVSSNYMYAYSLVFHVSMDFLYGKTDIFSDNYDVRNICEKTGLSEKAVENLLSDEEVYICDFAFDDFVYAIKEDSEYEKVIHFWDKLLASDLYTKFPESYYRMACSTFFYELCLREEKNLRQSKSELPSKNVFIDRVNEYSAHNHNMYIPRGMTLEDIYDNDKPHALSILNDIEHEHWSAVFSDLKQIESIYWGCSGQFDRFIQNYFHDQAKRYDVKLYNMQDEEF